MGAGGCPVVATWRVLQQLRAGHQCVHRTAPKYLQPLSRQQPGTVGTCGQLKLFLNMHYTELCTKSLQHSRAQNWNVLPDHIPRQSQILKTKQRTLLSSTCSTFLPIYFILFCITCTLLAVICNSSPSVVSVLSKDKSFTAIIINSVPNSSH